MKTKKILNVFIIGLIIVFIAMCLSGCSRKTPVETAFDESNQAIVAIKDSLPTECKTDLVLSKFNEVESKQQIAKSTCESTIKDYKIKYQRAVGLIILIFLGIFLRFFIKK